MAEFSNFSIVRSGVIATVEGQPASKVCCAIDGHGLRQVCICISGLVVEYIVAIDVTRVRFPADALFMSKGLRVSIRCFQVEIFGWMVSKKSGHPESNQGPSDYCKSLQSDALPTEL